MYFPSTENGKEMIGLQSKLLMKFCYKSESCFFPPIDQSDISDGFLVDDSLKIKGPCIIIG